MNVYETMYVQCFYSKKSSCNRIHLLWLLEVLQSNYLAVLQCQICSTLCLGLKGFNIYSYLSHFYFWDTTEVNKALMYICKRCLLRSNKDLTFVAETVINCLANFNLEEWTENFFFILLLQSQIVCKVTQSRSWVHVSVVLPEQNQYNLLSGPYFWECMYSSMLETAESTSIWNLKSL